MASRVALPAHGRPLAEIHGLGAAMDDLPQMLNLLGMHDSTASAASSTSISKSSKRWRSWSLRTPSDTCSGAAGGAFITDGGAEGGGGEMGGRYADRPM